MADRSVQFGPGTETPGFVIRQSDESADWQSDSNPRETVGGFVVTDAPEQQSAAGVEARVRVDQPLPRARRCSICGQFDHNARSCPNAEGVAGFTTRARKAPSKDAVESIAPMIVGTANFAVATTWGSDCGLSELEAKLLIPSVQRTMARMPAAAAARAAIVIDPLVILVVILMWAKRIIAIQDLKAREKYAIRPEEMRRANGVADSVFTVPPEQQTANAPVDANRAPRAPHRNAQPTSDVPTPDQINPTGGGVPQAIRESFTNDNNFGSSI